MAQQAQNCWGRRGDSLNAFGGTYPVRLYCHVWIGAICALSAGIPWPLKPSAVLIHLLDRLIDLLPIILAIILALLLSSAQLLPTLELSQHSIRSGGLTYNEVVSFSLNPLKVWLTFLPPYWVNLESWLGPAFSEFVAYIGLIPLVLVGLALFSLKRKRDEMTQAIGLTGAMGLLLAFGLFTGPIYYLLYKLVPGFDLFRVPARWLLLYSFGMAILAGIGFQQLKRPNYNWPFVCSFP